MGLIARKGNQGHLSLVKGARSPRLRAGVSNHSKLSEAERNLLIEYCKLASLDGICVGALVGSDVWDIRPMVIQGGELTITRFSDPSQEFKNSDYNSMLSLCMRLTSLENNPSNLTYGTSNGQIWTRRTFFKHTFADTPTESQAYSLSELYKKSLLLLKLVQNFHSAGVFHGHITATNLVWQNGSPILLDFGFSSYARDREILQDIAPEIAGGGRPGVASDIYGAGLVLKDLFTGRESSDEEHVIESMLSLDPSVRPTVHNLIEFFSARLSQYELPQVEIPELSVNLPTELELEAEPININNQESQLSVFEPINTEGNFEEITIADKKNNSSPIILALIVVAVILFGYRVIGGLYDKLLDDKPTIDANSFQVMWLSNQPSQLKSVALAAVRDNDINAQRVIVGAALNGYKALKVKNDLIKIAFDPRWEAELQEQDRSLILKLALAGLVPEEGEKIDNLNERHPGVLLGIIATLPVNIQISQFNGVPVSKLAGLPHPFGNAFAEMSKVGVDDLTDLSVRALSHILTGQGGEQEISQFFSRELDEVKLFKKLRIISPVLSDRRDLELPIYTHLLASSQLFAQMIKWFDDESLAEWEKIDRAIKIQILAGQWPSKELSFQQYVDLMKFPNRSIAAKAKEKLQDSFYQGKFGSLLGFFASSENRLTRKASITILAALSLGGQESPSFYGTWFEEKPDPGSVISLIIIRSDAPKDDIFNISGARYLLALGRAAPQPTFEELKKLVAHPEDLVRAFAYSKLRKSNQQEFRLLQNMASAERNSKLAAMLKNLLKGKSTL